MNIKDLFIRVHYLVKEILTPFGGMTIRFSKTLFASILLFFFLLPYETSAQCAMCRAVLESEENIALAEGVNNGIVYLMAIPYVLVGALFYFVYRKMKS